MSNRVRYDSLLVRYLADELNDRLRGERLRGLSLDTDRRIAVLEFDQRALSWHLHPEAGWVIAGRSEVTPEVVRLIRQARVSRVWAPADERVLVIDLSGVRRPGRTSRVVVELLGNQWNLIAVGPDDRIVGVLWRRRSGTRLLRTGQEYLLPPASGRRGVEQPLDRQGWEELISEVPPSDRARLLIAQVAYMSPINVGPILGDAGDGSGGDHPVSSLADTYDRYIGLLAPSSPEPQLLTLPGGAQPYPLPLPGVPGSATPSLLSAMAMLAERESPGGVAQGLTVSLEALDRLRGRIGHLERREARLRSELEEATSAAVRHRHEADLLLANLYQLRRGLSEIELRDWEGEPVMIELDPALGPNENVDNLYERSRRETRAAERLPGMIEGTSNELRELTRVRELAARGEITTAEVDAIVPAVERTGRVEREGEPLPYRRYRTSNGLEVRVGRSSRGNDDLTFRHSSPNDIWLHARDVAGAHVILRWPRVDANPPARDLLEAAILAGLHSRARTSGTVAVDWTRRKYLRKPRKSGPGQVTFERGRTLFVEPDAGLERRLRIDEG